MEVRSKERLPFAATLRKSYCDNITKRVLPRDDTEPPRSVHLGKWRCCLPRDGHSIEVLLTTHPRSPHIPLPSFVVREASGVYREASPPKTRPDAVHGYMPSIFLIVIEADRERDPKHAICVSGFCVHASLPGDVGRKTVASIACRESGRVAVTHTMRSLPSR